MKIGNQINYKDGDIIGKCIFLKELDFVTYTKPTGKIQRKRIGVFKCICGKEFKCEISSIKNESTKSCGCIKTTRLKTNPIRKTHGLRYHPLYLVWKAMRYRCTVETYGQFYNYGGRGIKICDRWNNVQNFIEDLSSTYIKGLELDRIDNDGDYEPNNCRWVTHSENNNNKRDNRRLEYNGETKTMRQWSDFLNIKYSTLQQRVNSMSIEDAFTKSFLTRKRNK